MIGGDHNTVKMKFTKGAFVKGVRYLVGDIDVISEGDALHLYGMGDAEPHSDNFTREKFGLPKENNFANVHGKNI